MNDIINYLNIAVLFIVGFIVGKFFNELRKIKKNNIIMRQIKEDQERARRYVENDYDQNYVFLDETKPYSLTEQKKYQDWRKKHNFRDKKFQEGNA